MLLIDGGKDCERSRGNLVAEIVLPLRSRRYDGYTKTAGSATFSTLDQRLRSHVAQLELTVDQIRHAIVAAKRLKIKHDVSALTSPC